jgi:hypothetical protein
MAAPGKVERLFLRGSTLQAIAFNCVKYTSTLDLRLRPLYGFKTATFYFKRQWSAYGS